MRVRASLLCLCFLMLLSGILSAEEPAHIGSRRELFIDDWMIGSLDGARQELHHPVPQEIAITYDGPAEGNISYYVRILKDGDLYRMYYRGAHHDWSKGKVTHEVVCYAESDDAIHWRKPELGLFEFNGSKKNNIVWMGIGAHNFSPFLDTNPACKADEKYKSLGRGKGGLYAFASADGIHWRLLKDKPVITKGAFDSQNLAFWDEHRQEYVDFHRGFTNKVRAIMTCTSDDFVNWTPPKFIDIKNSPPQHLYTNATIAYPRAPHLFLAFPKRFVPSRKAAWHPDPKNNHSGVSDGVLMTSRDGMHWNRWDEAFLRPGQNRERWWQRNNHIAWGITTTPSPLPGHVPELSLYAIENYYVGPCRLRRFTLRQDGFVSINAPFTGGEMTTRPITFDGPQGKEKTPVELELNLSTSAAGSVKCELLDEKGQPLPGFSLKESEEFYGDELDHVMTWKGKSDLSQFAGKPIRVRFVLKDADLYSLRFRNGE